MYPPNAILLLLLLTLPAFLTAQQPHFRQLYLSGEVVTEDGGPPPEPVQIELRCENTRQPQALTDRKGHFNFPVGGLQHRQIEDASRDRPMAPVGSTMSDRSDVSLAHCELEGRLAGYTSSKIYLGRRSVFESPDVGTIVLRRQGGQGEGVFVSPSTREAPQAARKAYEKAVKENAKANADARKVTRELERAVAVYPLFSEAWNLLGETRIKSGDLGGARAALTQAVEGDRKFVPPLMTLALMDLKQNKAQEAAVWIGRALKLLPGLAEAHYYNAVAQWSVGNTPAAEASLRTVHASPEAAEYPRTYFMLGNICANRGDAKLAAAEFRRFLELESHGAPAEAVRKRLAEWESAGLLR